MNVFYWIYAANIWEHMSVGRVSEKIKRYTLLGGFQRALEGTLWSEYAPGTLLSGGKKTFTYFGMPCKFCEVFSLRPSENTCTLRGGGAEVGELMG